MKVIDKETAEEFCSTVESEGLEYWLCDYTDETYPGTEVEPLIIEARRAMKALREKMDLLKQRYELEIE